MSSALAHLQHALIRIATVSPRVIASPPTQPRRASVALILRIRPAVEDEAWLASKWRAGEVNDEDAHLFPTLSTHGANAGMSVEARLRQFFSLPWVQRGTPELLYIKRAARDQDKWSSHVAFPGGRRDEEDENGLYTAMRETWEEVGIDLAERDFLHVGHLEDREITSSLGKRLLMILSPYVFVQLSPFSPMPTLQSAEASALYWVPLTQIYTPTPHWGTIMVDVARHAPRSSTIQWLLRLLIGKMEFRCIELPNKPLALVDQAAGTDAELGVGGQRLLDEEEQEHLAQTTPHLQLWGLTTGMTLDFVAHMSTYEARRGVRATELSLVQRLLEYAPSTLLLGKPGALAAQRPAPSMTEVFPRFNYPDVNLYVRRLLAPC